MTKEEKEAFDKRAEKAKTMAEEKATLTIEEEQKLKMIFSNHHAYKTKLEIMASFPLKPGETLLEHPLVQNHEPEVFMGFTFYYRDVEIPEKIMLKYYPGQFLRHPLPLDVTSVGQGLATSTRFLIASTTAVPLFPQHPEAKKWRQYEIQANSRFKVLEVFKTKFYSQVLLLHIPEEANRKGEAIDPVMEEKLIEKGKDNFRWYPQLPVVPELYSNEWLRRTLSPIGVDENGDFYS